MGKSLDTAFARRLGIAVPIVCGAMYPCSNPELVAAVSAAGGIGVLQPLTLTYVHGLDFRAGVRRILALSGGAPIGMNALIEQSSRVYHRRMMAWVDIALEEGVRFFVTSLGNPRWVVDRVTPAGGTVYHDVTAPRWARKAVDAGVHGLIAVNDRALMLRLGYAEVQMGTRFIATEECAAHEDYKRAIVAAGAEDIVLTERVTGVPLSVIRTSEVECAGTRVSALGRWMLAGRRTKRLARTWYALRAVRRLGRSVFRGDTSKDYWQAGKSVAGITAVAPVATILREFADAALTADG